MSTFQKIDDRHCQYNKNVLPVDFLNTNTHAWTSELSPGTFGTITAELQTEIKYLNKGLRVIVDNFVDNNVQFSLLNPTHYSFSPEVNGDHIFSFVVYSNSMSPVEVRGFLNLYEYPSLFSPFAPFEFAIGNNTSPEFSFQYRKFETFFVKMTLDASKTYIMDWGILQEIASPFPGFDLTFDLFKLEYVGDKRQDTPSFYTKPGE